MGAEERMGTPLAINTWAPNACVRHGHSSRTEMASKDPFESPSQDSVAPHRGDEEQERSSIRYEREPTVC